MPRIDVIPDRFSFIGEPSVSAMVYKVDSWPCFDPVIIQRRKRAPDFSFRFFVDVALFLSNRILFTSEKWNLRKPKIRREMDQYFIDFDAVEKS